MTSMIERVARALMKADIGPLITDEPDHWEAWIPDARAALSALADPTEEMIDKADDAFIKWTSDDYWPSNETYKIIWQAMIQEAMR